MATHNELGKTGEQIAVDYLKNKNYRIRERNWRYRKAEIDIIAEQNTTLVVVEVKTRSSIYFGNPQDFISKKQINSLVLATDAYLSLKKLQLEVRFDIISIVVNHNKVTNIQHIENGFLHF
ncbi:MAG: YraN family protein [Flavicella sp.]